MDHHLNAIGSTTTIKDPASGRTVDKKLKAKVDESIKFFIGQGTSKKEFDGVLKALSDKYKPLSPDLLHAYVHNRFLTPVPADLTAAWDNALPLLGRIWA